MLKMLDLFSGVGVGVAAQAVGGIEEYGVEIAPEVVRTRDVAGFHTPYNDVWEIEKAQELGFGPDWAMWASPPCQSYSISGKGNGRRALDHVITALHERRWEDIDSLRGLSVELGEDGDKTALVLTPLAYIHRYRPRFIGMEQVPAVLPVWEDHRGPLEEMGYSVWVGYLHSEQYGMVATCPLHEISPVEQDAEAYSFAPQKLATAESAGTLLAGLLASAQTAKARKTYLGQRNFVSNARTGVGITSRQTVALKSAFDVALIARVVLDSVKDATWRMHVAPLLSLALLELRILPGRAGGMSMSADTSTYESMGLTIGSIESLPSRLWAAVSARARLYITSTEQQTTTKLATSQFFVATPTTYSITELVGGKASCGACDDWATPQTRKRAYLIARNDGIKAEPPVPTHSKYYSRDPKRMDEGVLPWVSMAEALGWGDFIAEKRMGSGMVERYGERPGRDAELPAFTIRGSAGGMEPGGFRLRRGLGGRPSPTITGGGTETGGAEPIAKLARYTESESWVGDTRRLSVEEAARLQSFPDGIDFKGRRGDQYLIIGNSVPPLQAMPILQSWVDTIEKDA